MRVPLALVLVLAGGACDGGPDEARGKAPPPVPLVERMPPVDPARCVAGTLLVAGMTCSGCEHNVGTALRLVEGVLEAEADHASGETHVRYDPERTSLAALAEAVRAAGYSVASTQGPTPR